MDYKITTRKFQGGKIVPLICVPRMKHVAAAISDEKSFSGQLALGPVHFLLLRTWGFII
jgi:hypothetical protein